jgi:hypothetical protein
LLPIVLLRDTPVNVRESKQARIPFDAVTGKLAGKPTFVARGRRGEMGR